MSTTWCVCARACDVTTSSSPPLTDANPSSARATTQGLQIVGLFAIIVASFIGIVLSFVFEWAGKRVNATTKASMDIFMVLMRGAGTGVLISTALIHLIGEAYECACVRPPHLSPTAL